jgi:ribonuclease P protein component
MYRLPKEEKLCSRTKIEQLFADGQSYAQYPLRIVYRIHPKNTPEERPQFFISVPKRKFKRAVKRVWLRRRIREAYRLNKHIIPDMGNKTIDMAFLTFIFYPPFKKSFFMLPFYHRQPDNSLKLS